MEGEEPISDFKPRSYQQEMFEESLKRNIIVVMAAPLTLVLARTGSGKTDIAIMRVAAELERCETGQLAWILTPNGALCTQQYQKFAERLPMYQHRLLLGSDGVDKWKDKSIWDHILQDIRIVISTPQILLDALDSGFVRLAKIALLVLDEAHRARKESPMRVIMRNWLDSAPVEQRPATLSLTASPADWSSLENTMHAEVRTPKLCRAELARFVHLPELIIVPYDSVQVESWPGFVRLFQQHEHYDFKSDPYVLRMLQQGIDSEDPLMAKAFQERKTTCVLQLKRILNKTTEIVTQLGTFAADWYVRKIISKLKSTAVSMVVKDLASDERKHLLAVLDKSLQDCKPISEFESNVVTVKFNMLVDQLASNAAQGSTGIIFAKQRATVAALSHLLSIHPITGSAFRYGPFVGSSQTGDKVDIGDLFDMRAQDAALKDFRAGSGNILVATNVLEEGIDIPSCNFVICFDEPDNVVSFVQRRGRARQEKSKYVLFMDRYSNKVERFQALEEAMIKSYEDDQSRIRRELEKELLVENVHREWIVESTGAKLTLENAKRRLFHFLQTVAVDNTNIHPEYEFVTVSADMKKAKVILPNIVLPELRTHAGTEHWRTERAAARDASFVAVLALHSRGLINDNLLPILSGHVPELVEIDRSLQATTRTAPRINPWYELAALWNAESSVIPLNIVVESRHPPLTMTFLTPVSLLSPPDVVLYGMANDVAQVKWQQNMSELMETSKLGPAREFAKIAMSTVLPNRVKGDQDDFIIPFAPLELLAENSADAADRMYHLGNRASISKSSFSLLESSEVGLVRDSRLLGRMFMPELIHEAIPSRVWAPKSSTEMIPELAKELCIRASSFAKRMYGLNTNKDRERWKPQSVDLPLQYSTMDMLPLKYARFVLMYPAMLHYWETFLLAAQCRRTLLNPVNLVRDDYLTEALSAPSARIGQDYERLEFLGDRLLKLAVALHLMNKYPYWPEKYLAFKRDILVSNVYLARNALQSGLDRFISTAAFAGRKWRPSYVHEAGPPKVDERRVISTKVIADVVEAVIAVAYLEGSEDKHAPENLSSSETDKAALNKACTCINILLPSADLLQPTAALDELNNAARSGGPSTSKPPPDLEKLIGYNFRIPALLMTARTHPSFRLDQSPCYNRLEYFGDAVLDHLVTRKLFFHPSKMPPSRLHSAKECLVNADFLAYICLGWSVNVDRTEVELTPGSALFDEHPEFNLTTNVIQYKFWNSMRHGSMTIAADQRAAANRFESLSEGIREALETGTMYPWRALTELRAPKFLSDIIESLIGAVYIDSHGSLSACEELIERMGITKYLCRILAEQDSLVLLHPKERVGILARDRTVEYVLESSESGHDEMLDDTVKCTVYVAGCEIASVSGKGLKRAQIEVLAASEAAAAMEAHGSGPSGSTHDDELDSDDDDNGDDASEEEQTVAGTNEI